MTLKIDDTGWFEGLLKIGYCVFRMVLHIIRVRPYDKD